MCICTEQKLSVQQKSLSLLFLLSRALCRFLAITARSRSRCLEISLPRSHRFSLFLNLFLAACSLSLKHTQYKITTYRSFDNKLWMRGVCRIRGVRPMRGVCPAPFLRLGVPSILDGVSERSPASIIFSGVSMRPSNPRIRFCTWKNVMVSKAKASTENEKEFRRHTPTAM